MQAGTSDEDLQEDDWEQDLQADTWEQDLQADTSEQDLQADTSEQDLQVQLMMNSGGESTSTKSKSKHINQK